MLVIRRHGATGPQGDGSGQRQMIAIGALALLANLLCLVLRGGLRILSEVRGASG